MIITEDFIIAGRVSTGGWNARQLSFLGIEWPPFQGWIESLVGTEISEENAIMFLQAKGMKAKKKRKRNRKK